MKNFDNHTFVVCAYGESPYLSDCLDSLLSQTVKSRILIATATPNAFIRETAARYGFPLYEAEKHEGIGQDWNFAMSCTETDYVTVAHQDDIYLPDYVKEITKHIDESKRQLLFFTNYNEFTGERLIDKTRNLKIKRMLTAPLKLFPSSRFYRRRMLSLGNVIGCPSVTFNTKLTGRTPFVCKMDNDLDWDTWEHFSKEKGQFVYISRVLMHHRIHEGSGTTAAIKSGLRQKEDYLMMCKFWPKPIAGLLCRGYNRSLKTKK